MTDKETRDLCMALLHADSEDQVIAILTDAGYWQTPSVWRYYGDDPTNFKIFFNQANNPESALVEKLTNNRDARLMNACVEAGVDPKGSDAPRTLRDAVGQFFEENPGSVVAGEIREWSTAKRTDEAKKITCAATGKTAKDGGYPSITVSDQGEGQAPRSFPRTLCSLSEKNKEDVPFLHGRFNMGGTAALRFCGKHNLQLIISKRNPKLLKRPIEEPTDTHWGFTIVKRQLPEGKSLREGSVFVYLAPVGSDYNSRKGSVLNFPSTTLPIFPEKRKPYSRHSEWGTTVKLYEYETSYRTNMMLDSGLLRPLDLLLPDIGLPVRLYECRDFKGKPGSFQTTLSGLKVRLFDDKAESLEEGFPNTHIMRVAGNSLKVTLYAFKKNKASTYRKASEGILFVLNGQTQAKFYDAFFSRKKVGLDYLRHDLLVLVDCSELKSVAIEDLFMASRDRMIDSPVSKEILDELEELLKRHPGLKLLREERHRKDTEQAIKDEKPTINAFMKLLKAYPRMADTLLRGKPLPNPFKPTPAKPHDSIKFEGQRYPTFFKLKKVEYGDIYERDCPINHRARIAFETDAENNYIGRDVDPGTCQISLLTGQSRVDIRNGNFNLYNGTATLNLHLPGNANVGDRLLYEVIVTDPQRIAVPPFINKFELTLLPPQFSKSSPPSPLPKPPTPDPTGVQTTSTSLNYPDIIEVCENPSSTQKRWSEMTPPFDKSSALKIIHFDTVDGIPVYDYFLNMDNIHLKDFIKRSSSDGSLIAQQFKFAMGLIGLALISEDYHKNKNGSRNGTQAASTAAPTIPLSESVELVTKAIAVILLPMLTASAEWERMIESPA